MKRQTILLLLILCIGAAIRLWQLGHVPPSPDWDEAALGYNAYSIMQTGKDEYGKFLPVVLRSFDDYKPAMYAYFIIPFIPVFGLNIISVRLPAVLFGLLAIVATYYLVKELFGEHISIGKKHIPVYYFALTASFLLAIAPWHIQFSRIAFESQIGDAFNIFSALFLLKGLKKPWFLSLATFCMAFNLYVYQSEKVFTPLLFMAFVIIYRKQLFAISKRYLILAALIGIITALPMIYYTVTNKEALARARGVSVFADQTQLLKNNAVRLIEDKKNHDIIGQIVDNRRILFGREIIFGYLSHYDLNWLFIKGDLARHHAPQMGLLYLWELPFLLIGIYLLLRSNIDKKAKWFIFAWFLLVPIPASITSGVPHAVRTLNFLPTFQIFTALGIIAFYNQISNIKYQISKIKIKYVILASCFLFLTFNILYYLDQYFVQQNYYNSKEWQYGYEEAVSTVKSVENNYYKIIVSNKPHLDQSYMFFLFYLQYSPMNYHQESQKVSGGFKENHQFGKYEFRPIQWDIEQKASKILYVGRPNDIPDNAHILKTIYFLNGDSAIKIAEG